jgi:predicted nuclease of restriction endonuclease-like (RecB) superfamily
MDNIIGIQLIEYILPIEFINELRVISKFTTNLRTVEEIQYSVYELPNGYPFIITDNNKLIIIEPKN